jgi:putative transposase
MRPSRFTEDQIIGMVKEQEAGAKTADVCRKHGISAATFYKFKAKFGGMEVSDARRLKALGDENARLKKLLAGQGGSRPMAVQGPRADTSRARPACRAE